MYLFFIFIFHIILIGPLFARGPGEGFIPIGNFSLPVSQRPGPLFSFGQNFVEKNDLLVFATPVTQRGHGNSYTEIIPSLLYGISDNLFFYTEVPFATTFRSCTNCSRGIGDILLQFEHPFYENNTKTRARYMTVVASMTIPTGSARKSPPTGFGSPSFFLGITAGRLATDWYLFVSPGILFTTPHQKSRFGNQFLYQWGIGRNIAYKSDRWILTALVEFDGFLIQHDKQCGRKNLNSGGNIIIISPSLWFSTHHLSLQFGIGGFIMQRLHGKQETSSYIISGSLGWKF